MSGRIKKLELSPEALQSLDLGYRTGATHCFRTRCIAVLLKAKDYIEKQQLFYATKKALAALRNNLYIK